MKFKKQGFPLQKIRQTDSGQVEWVAGLFFLLILAIVLYTRLQLASWSSTAVYMEDALAASNLAAAVIDLEEYGRTHTVCIKDEKEAFAIYKDALRANLGLDEQWKCLNESLITGPVEIVNFTIYNVTGQQVESILMGMSGDVLERRSDAVGTVTAPDGSIVEHTGIYSEIKFSVKGFPGMMVEAGKGKLVDIVAEEGAMNENR